MSLPLAQCYAIMIESMPLPIISAAANANVNIVEAPMHAVKEQQDRSETRAPSRDNSYKEMLSRARREAMVPSPVEPGAEAVEAASSAWQTFPKPKPSPKTQPAASSR